MSTPRARMVLKGIAESSLAALAWGTRPAGRRRGSVVLAYHNVQPSGVSPVGEHSLHMPWDRFLEHLDLIQSVAKVVTIEEALSSDGFAERLRIALTFDDAYSGAVELALPEIAQRGLSTTMFVAPALLEGRSFWWDQLAQPQNGELPQDVRSHALSHESGEHAKVQAWATAQHLPWVSALPAWATGASLTALRHSASLPGISIGAHSWAHPNLTTLKDGALRDELERPRRWLQEQGLDTAAWLAYPYGMATAETAIAAEDAGYSGAFLVSGGFIAERHSRFLLPRINVPAGLTPAGLRLRLSGWLTR